MRGVGGGGSFNIKSNLFTVASPSFANQICLLLPLRALQIKFVYCCLSELCFYNDHVAMRECCVSINLFDRCRFSFHTGTARLLRFGIVATCTNTVGSATRSMAKKDKKKKKDKKQKKKKKDKSKRGRRKSSGSLPAPLPPMFPWMMPTPQMQEKRRGRWMG